MTIVRSNLILLTGVIAISFAATLIRLTEAPAIVTAAYRMVFASLIILPIWLGSLRKNSLHLTGGDWLKIISAGFFLALHFGLWITSLEMTSIASSVVLVTSHPVFVAIASWIIFKEHISRRIVAGIVIALAGVMIVNLTGLDTTGSSVYGNLMAIGAAAAMGSYLLVGQGLKNRMKTIDYLQLVYSFSALFLVAAVFVSGETLLGYPIQVYGMLLLLALVSQVIGHSCLNIAVRLIPATFVSVAILGEPVLASVLGVVVLHEIPGIWEITGGLIILGGIIIVLTQRHDTKKT